MLGDEFFNLIYGLVKSGIGNTLLLRLEKFEFDLSHDMIRKIKLKKEEGNRKRKVPPRFELGSLDSKSRVLTITPWDPQLIRGGKFMYRIFLS